MLQLLSRPLYYMMFNYFIHRVFKIFTLIFNQVKSGRSSRRKVLKQDIWTLVRQPASLPPSLNQEHGKFFGTSQLLMAVCCKLTIQTLQFIDKVFSKLETPFDSLTFLEKFQFAKINTHCDQCGIAEKKDLFIYFDKWTKTYKRCEISSNHSREIY